MSLEDDLIQRRWGACQFKMSLLHETTTASDPRRVTPAPAATRSSPATGANPAESTRTRIRGRCSAPASMPPARDDACLSVAGARAHGGTNDDRCTGMRRPTSSPPAHSRAHPANSSDPAPSSNHHIAQLKACRTAHCSLIITPNHCTSFPSQILNLLCPFCVLTSRGEQSPNNTIRPGFHSSYW